MTNKKNKPGFWGAAIVLLMVAVGAGYILYNIFANDKEAQSGLGGAAVAVAPPARYKVTPPHPALPGNKEVSADLPQPVEEKTASEGGTDTDAEKTPAAPDTGGEDASAALAGEKPDKTVTSDDPLPEAAADRPLASAAVEKDGELLAGKEKPNPDPALSKTMDRKSDPKSDLVSGPETLYVKIPVGRVRQSPSTDARTLFYLKQGDKVSVSASRDGWYQINTEDGRTGWAHGMLFSMDAPAQPAADDNLIRAILVETPVADRQTVKIVLNNYHLPHTMVLEGERPRVVSDFFGLHLSPGMKKKVEYGTGIVRAIRLGIHAGKKPKIRVVVDLIPEHDYIVEQQFIMEDNIYQLDIRFK